MLNRADDLEHLAAYQFEGRNEAEIRGDWIDPLLRLLGYGLGTLHEVRREQTLVLRPPVRMVGASRLKVDYVPTVHGRRLWIIEAKRPQIGDDLFSAKHLGQAWCYATDPRVATPLMVLCDGVRVGVFDLTKPAWDTPVFDKPKDQLSASFSELRGWIGARQVAERVRRRQLGHLRTALEAQIDLDSLDSTLSDVRAIVEEARPIVMQRRGEIRRVARQSAQRRGAAAQEAAGMWGHAQSLHLRWLFSTLADCDKGAAIVRGQPSLLRVREFESFEKATTPRGKTHSRMWFWARIARMGCAVLLVDDDGCGEHCRAAATQAARGHATCFADDKVTAAAHRLQRLLGPLSWRLAAYSKPALDRAAQQLVDDLDPEDWLRVDGVLGVTPERAYTRAAMSHATHILAAIDPWDVPTITAAASAAENALESLPRLAAMDGLQPAGDPWLDSWLRNDPLPDASAGTLQRLAQRSTSPSVAAFAAELHAQHCQP